MRNVQTGKSIETESRLMVAKGRRGAWGMTASGCGFLFEVMKMF
jgi:hypothetical protein